MYVCVHAMHVYESADVHMPEDHGSGGVRWKVPWYFFGDKSDG